MAEIAARWAEDRLDTGLGEASWIAPNLLVARLFDSPAGSAAPGAAAWPVHRGMPAPETASQGEELARALAAWREAHGRESTLLDGVGMGATEFSGRTTAMSRITCLLDLLYTPSRRG